MDVVTLALAKKHTKPVVLDFVTDYGRWIGNGTTIEDTSHYETVDNALNNGNPVHIKGYFEFPVTGLQNDNFGLPNATIVVTGSLKQDDGTIGLTGGVTVQDPTTGLFFQAGIVLYVTAYGVQFATVLSHITPFTNISALA